jgi:carboxyl-terminal processing protease
VDEKNINSLQNYSGHKLEKNRKLFKRYLVLFVSAVILIITYSAGVHEGKKNPDVIKSVPLNQSLIENKLPSQDQSVDFSLFWKVWDLLKEKHIDRAKIDAQKMVYGAISGMLKATGDPYTSFFNPEENKSFSEELEGSFEGIGAELGFKDQVLTVVAPLDGSPAQKAGLMAGDKIFKIDDKIVTDLTLDDAVNMVRGAKGTTVKLTILRTGEQDTRDVVVTRDIIEIKSVKTEFKDGDIASIKITKFGDTTDKEFQAAVASVIKNKSKGLIIDLRNNPGGLLDKAVNMASLMIPKGKVVVTEEDSDGKRTDLKTTGGDKLSSVPTVVLINEGSASASEILAGALKDDQGTPLVGKKSFGKGSVQELVNLPGGSSVKITVAKWLTPGGDYIMEKGIMPDDEVDLTSDDIENKRDPQMDKAVEVLKDKMR